MADDPAHKTTGSITTLICLSVPLGDADRRQVEALCAEVARLRLVEIAARNVAVNANRGNDGVSAVPGCVIDDLREALRHVKQ